MQIFFDSLHRVAYSTDASTYREVPQGVAYPETTEDIVELVAEAFEVARPFCGDKCKILHLSVKNGC